MEKASKRVSCREAVPIILITDPHCLSILSRYDFVPPVKYNYLDAEEAEERFEKRNKTLNYFSVMLSKKLKDSEEGEEGGSAGLGDMGKDAKVKEKKKAAVDSGLVIGGSLYDHTLPCDINRC